MNRPKKASKTLTFQLGAPPTFANTSNCQTAGSLPYAPPFYYSCSSPQTHTHLLPSSSILYVSFIDPVPFSRTRHCRPCKLWWKLRKPSPVSWRSPNPKGGKVEKWKSGKVETWKRGNVETWKRSSAVTATAVCSHLARPAACAPASPSPRERNSVNALALG